MPGYFSERLAEDVLDKLYAKAFVCCGSNGVKTAMVAIDANMIPEEIVVAAKKRIADHTDIPTENISVSATHNHNGGPTVSWGKLVRQEDSYMAFVADKAADAVIVANRHLRPARIGYGCGRVDDISFHRIYEMKNGTLQTNPGVHNPDVDRPAGPIDPDVTVLRVDDAETGKLLVSVNPAWFRPTDVNNLWGDPTKAKTVLGWNPQKTPYARLVQIMAEHDRLLAKREKALKEER